MWIELKKPTPLRGSTKPAGLRLYVNHRTGLRLITQGYAKRVEGRYSSHSDDYGMEDDTIVQVREAVAENNWNKMQRVKGEVCPEAEMKKRVMLERFEQFLNKHGYEMPEVGSAPTERD